MYASTAVCFHLIDRGTLKAQCVNGCHEFIRPTRMKLYRKGILG